MILTGPATKSLEDEGGNVVVKSPIPGSETMSNLCGIRVAAAGGRHLSRQQ